MPDSSAVLMIEVINNIDALYDRAWTHLMVFVVALTGIVGILLPILSQWYQRRAFRIEEAQIRSDLTTHIDLVLKGAVFEERMESIKEEVRIEVESLKTEHRLMLYDLEGKSFMLQGRWHQDRDDYFNAAGDYIRSAKLFLKGQSEINYQALPEAIEFVLSELTQSDIDDELEEDFDELLSVLNKNNENRRYSRDLKSLKKAMQEARSRGTDEVALG